MRCGDRRVLPEHFVRPRELNDDLNRAADGGEDHLATERRDLTVQREDSPKPRRIEDSCARKIEDEIADAFLDTTLTGRLEVGRVAEVEGLPDADDSDVVRDILYGDAHSDSDG